uniref:Uncharacterized protein n=1 Tax=Moniliophthora roreri TaxID=221103 RepID=A0A0W0F2Q9_MONRR
MALVRYLKIEALVLCFAMEEFGLDYTGNLEALVKQHVPESDFSRNQA